MELNNHFLLHSNICILMKLLIKFQKTALHLAVEKENIEIIKLILEKNIDIEDKAIL